MKFYSKDKQGFTLVEMMVVVGIIGVLSSIIFVAIASAREQARDNSREADLAQIKLAIRLDREAGNSYPTTDQLICSSCSSAVNTAVQTYIGNLEDPRHDGTTYFYQFDASADEICANQMERSGQPLCIPAR